MTQKARGFASFWQRTSGWASNTSLSVTEKGRRSQPEWLSVGAMPQERPLEGTSIDDLVAEFEAEGLDISGARQEMGRALDGAGDYSLRALRLKAGLSQRELGVRIGMSQPNVARLEREQCDPHLSTLLKLADALGVDLITLARAFR